MALQEEVDLKTFFQENEPLSIAKLENLFSSFGSRKAEAIKAVADASRDGMCFNVQFPFWFLYVLYPDHKDIRLCGL
jgi:hypothetical protein